MSDMVEHLTEKSVPIPTYYLLAAFVFVLLLLVIPCYSKCFMGSLMFPSMARAGGLRSKISTRKLDMIALRGGAGEGVGISVEEEEDNDEDEQEFDSPSLYSLSKQSDATKYLVGMWVKTPPITQAYVLLSVSVSLLLFLFNGNEWPSILEYQLWPILTKLQVWRALTPFLHVGPLGLNFMFTMHFIWTYMSQLEKLSYKNPAEYVTMLGFGCIALLLGYSFLGLSSQMLGHNLSTYLVYIWARTFEGTDVSVMDFVVVKAEVIPWFFAAQAFLLDGGSVPYADLLGITIGHLYTYLKLYDMMPVPQIVNQIFQRKSIKKIYSRFRKDFE